LPFEVSQVYDYYSDEIEVKQSIIDKIDRENLLKQLETHYIKNDIGKTYIRQNSAAMLDVYSTNPAIMVVQEMPLAPLRPAVIAFDTCKRSFAGTKINVNNEVTVSDGSITSLKYGLAKGKYQFAFEAKKPGIRKKAKGFVWADYEILIGLTHLRAFGNHVRLKVSVFGDHKLLVEKTFDPTDHFMSMDTFFVLDEAQNVEVKIENIDNTSPDLLPAETVVRQLKITTVDL